MVSRRHVTIALRAVVILAIGVAAVATLSNCSSSRSATPSIATVQRA